MKIDEMNKHSQQFKKYYIVKIRDSIIFIVFVLSVSMVLYLIYPKWWILMNLTIYSASELYRIKGYYNSYRRYEND